MKKYFNLKKINSKNSTEKEINSQTSTRKKFNLKKKGYLRDQKESSADEIGLLVTADLKNSFDERFDSDFVPVDFESFEEDIQKHFHARRRVQILGEQFGVKGPIKSRYLKYGKYLGNI